jgi:predicted site-specific integrase-resolvase
MIAAPTHTDTTHLSPTQLSQRWNLSPKTLERWRSNGGGPAFVKLGNQVRYPLAEIERYEACRTRASTAEAVRA